MMRHRIITLAGIGMLFGFTAVGSGQTRHRGGAYDSNHRAIIESAVHLQRASRQFERELSRGHFRWSHLSRQAESFERDTAKLAHELKRGGVTRYALAESYRRVRRGYFNLRRGFHSQSVFGRNDGGAGNDGYYRTLRSWLQVVESFDHLNREVGRRGFGVGDSGGRPHGGAVDFGHAGGQGFHTTTVRCKSDNFRHNSCLVGGTIERVEVHKRKSQAACVPGRTYGHHGGSIWVDRGCDAEFRVSYRRR